MIDAILFRILRWRLQRDIRQLCRKDTAGWGSDWPYEQCVSDDNALMTAYFAQKRGRR